MKKYYATIIIFILALNPVLAFATDIDTNEPQPTQQVTEPEPAAQPQPDTTPAPTTPEDPVLEPTNPTPTNPENPVLEPTNPEPTNYEPKDKITEDPTEPVDDNDTDNDKPKTKGESDDEESEVSEDSEKSEEDDDKDNEEDTQKEHEHSFAYESNEDGTHTVKCTEMIETTDDDGEVTETECAYEEIEECLYNEEGICIYCDYEKPDEEVEFEPAINISINNQSCVIGKVNPVICVDISQDDFDVEYAQICFANYEKNKFINVGLAHGKYLNRKTDEYVYTDDSCWYSSPNITDLYEEGAYTVRSIYARCTNSDYIHYSIESDSLPDEFKNIAINLVPDTGDYEEEAVTKSDTDSFNFVPDPTVEEHINHNPSIEDPPETAKPNEDSIIENPTSEERTSTEPIDETPVVAPIDEPVVEHPTTDKSVANEPTTEEPVANEPTTEEPIIAKDVIDTPITEGPAENEASVDKPIVNEPTSEEAVDENKTAKDESVEVKPAEEPTNELPKEEPVAEAKDSNKKESNHVSFTQKIINQFFNFIKRLFRFW